MSLIRSLNLIKNGWGGKLIELVTRRCIAIRKLLNFFFSNSEIEVVNKTITKDNINSLVFTNN